MSEPVLVYIVDDTVAGFAKLIEFNIRGLAKGEGATLTIALDEGTITMNDVGRPVTLVISTTQVPTSLKPYSKQQQRQQQVKYPFS